MRRLAGIIWALLPVLLWGCSTISNHYAGSDAGRVVIGVGTVLDSPYGEWPAQLRFRRAGDKATGAFWWTARSLNDWSAEGPSPHLQYRTAEEVGIVQVVSLPPGKYEIFNFEARIKSIAVFSAKQDFSIPFDLRPNEVIYLGNFQINPIRSNTGYHGRVIPIGPFFVVEDRSRADLALAKGISPSLAIETIRNATPDVKAIRNPIFVSAADAEDARERFNSRMDTSTGIVPPRGDKKQ